ncbi:low molecular weight phosphatase family protein [Corynebacterium sp. TAE3-ERU12]|uniref:arsenate-mycothiol transferase ArsC n=1 Tax=Corynebacterium sp. TAE3-ERU12 TaxID=2849491 RepID=UPI001C44FEA0|nr:low molecular weight phosphatase family protein [Corynebacterium sp. TAE3-ERU12]MBV7296176.1 low molecular weight phosphatase family protein [Corynebacterium sp. TAE3-ERU12]
MIDRQLDIVREDLHRRFGQALPAADIDQILDDTIAAETASARVTSYLPVMIERAAAEAIKDEATSRGEFAGARKEILYVCERNAGRSQLADAITHHLVGDAVVVRSVGLEPADEINPTVIEVLKERGIATDGLFQTTIVPRVVHRSDIVVLMGVDEIPGVPGVRYAHWDVKDPEGASIEEVRAIADEIETQVRGLIAEMELPIAAA